jgi:nucleotide-binding universal stress UspA family protein
MVHVVTLPFIPAPRPPVTFNLPEYRKEMETYARRMFQELIEEKISRELIVRTRVELGNPAERIVESAAEERVDMIVIPTHGLAGWRRFVFGSVAERVIRFAPCPVLSIQHSPEGE